MTATVEPRIATHLGGDAGPVSAAPRRAGPWIHCWRLAMARPVLFWTVMALYGVFYTLPIGTGLLVRAVFDTLSGHAPFGLSIPWFIAGMIGVSVSVMGSIYLGSWSWTYFNYVFSNHIRGNMMGWLVFGPGPKSVPTTPGEALSRFRDDVFETMSFLEAWVDTGGQMLFGIVALGIMASFNWQVTVVLIVPMLIIAAITQWVTARIHYYRRVAREAAARVTSFIGEMFAAVQAIRVASAEHRIIRRMETLGDERRRTAVQDRLFIAYLDALGAGSSGLGVGLVLLLAAGAMRSGDFTVGDFTLFASYVGAASAAPRWVGRLLARHRTAQVAIGRVQTLMAGAPDLMLSAHRPLAAPAVYREGRADAFQSLSVSALTCRHPASERGVFDIDLTLRRGQVTVVTGRVGSGKTTLLRALLGLAEREAGQIRWNGELVSDPATFLVPPRVAYTPQSPRLFSESVRENVAMGSGGGDLGEAVRLAILEPDLAQLEAGLDTLVGTRGVTLSGGQVQRTAAARMFAAGSDLVVFDDISSALDVRTEAQFWERFFARGDATCLAVSHRREAYRHADEIIVLEEGRIAARGTLKSLLRDSEIFQRAWAHTEAEREPA
jgi:ABC-type multidrug transport system fused ATPase/permease subunit